MSGYTKKIRNGEIGQKTSAFDLSKHTNFGHIDDYSMSMPIDPAKAAGYSPEVVALAAKLKYQHEKDFEPSGCKTSKFNDEFYLQYAKRQLDLTFDSSFDKVLGGIDVAPDPAYAQYSYEEIIAMANNGVNIPKSVLAWAKAQQEADVVDYVVISDNVDYNDENSKDKENGESEINKIRLEVKDNALKAKKAQEDISKNREKTAELTNQASDIAKEQKNIFRNNSIDKTEQMVNEWKELDKKKNESGLDSAENAKYKQLSEKLDKSGEIIQSMKKSSAHLDNFLESIDSLNEEANEGITTAQKTINSASALTNLDDRLNTFVKVHAYKIADKSSGMLEDTLSNLDDVQLAYVSEKIGHDLEDLGNETFEDIHNDDTQEIIKFADAYVNKANHIEHDLGVDEENDDNKKSEKSEQKEQFAGSNTLAKGMNEMFEDNKNSLSDNPFGFMFSFMSNPEVAATFTAATILSTEFALTESAVLNGESVALGLLAEKEKKEDKKLEEVADESVDKFKSNNAKIGENEEKIEQIEENAKVQDSASGSIEISEATNDSLKQIKQLKQTQVTDNTEAESQELSLKEENELLSSENESLTNKVEKPLDDSAQALSKSKKYLKSVDANNQILKADTNELNEISNNTAKIATESLKASLTNVAISAGLYVAGTSMLPSPTGLFLIKTAAAWDITASLQLTGSAFATAGAVSGVVGAGVSELQNDATNSVVKAVTGSNKESKTLITETANEMGGLAAPEDIKENDNQQDNPVEDNVNSGQNEDENNNSSNVGFSNEAQEQDKNLVVQVPIGSPDEDKFTEPLFAPIVSQESKINFTASPLKDEQAEVAFAPARTRAAMTKNPYVNEEDEAESILENEEEQKIAQAPEVEEPEETEEIQEVAQVPEVEEPEETEEIQDVAQVPEVEEPGETEETQDVAQAPEVEEPEETEETQDVAQVPEVEETEETEDVAQVPEVEEPEETEEIQEVAQVPEVEEPEETEEIQDVAQVPEVEEPGETEETQDVAHVPEVEEPEETEEIQEVAQAPEVEQTEETEETEDIAEVPEVEQTEETEETEDIAEVPEVEQTEETEETQDVAQVPEVEQTEETEETQDVAQAPEVEEPGETEETQDVAHVPEVEQTEETEETEDVAHVPEVEQTEETEETEDVAQVPEVEEPEETEETEDVAQVPEVEEPEETEEIQDVAQVPEVEEPEETEEIQEVAQAPEVEQTEETEETEDVAQVPEVEQTEETEEIQDVAQAPEVEETQIINEGTFTGAASELQLAEAATISGKMKTRGYAGKSDNNENPNVIDSDVDESEPTVIPTIEAENTPSENTQDFSNGSEQIQEEPAPVENEPVSLNETPQEPVLDSSSGEGVINSTDDIRDYVRGAVSMGKQPQEIISSLSNATRSTNVEAPIQTTPKNDSGKTEQVNKTSEKQNEQKQEKISDPQAELKSAYGSNEDFVKLVIANSIVELIALGPVAFTFNLIKVASIVGLSVLDLFSKKDIVNQSSQLADADVQTANTATSQLVSKSNEIKAKHDKNVVLAKSYAAQYKVLNDDSINAQFEMMQNQALLLQEGKITQDQVQSDFADINAGEKDAIRTNVAKISEKDSNMLNSINEPSSKLEKTLKQTNKLVTGFDGLNEKLSERNENNNQMGDVVIAESITSQIIITGIIAALLACGPWCWGLVALWAAVLGQNVAFAATGVAAKIASNKVDGNIDSNIQKVKDAHKTMANIDKQAADVRKVMKKASLDKMNYLPPQEEQETLGQMPMPEQNDNNRNDTEFGDNDDARNSVISFVRKDSDTRSGFDKSSWNAEIDINNPNDVKKANEYAIAYTRDVNDADEKSKAAASTNASAQGDTTTKADVKLARFNRDGAKDSSKRSKKVNATSASHNGRKRR